MHIYQNLREQSSKNIRIIEVQKLDLSSSVGNQAGFSRASNRNPQACERSWWRHHIIVTASRIEHNWIMDDENKHGKIDNGLWIMPQINIKRGRLTLVIAIKGIHPIDMVIRTKMTIRVHEGHSSFDALAVSFKRFVISKMAAACLQWR